MRFELFEQEVSGDLEDDVRDEASQKGERTEKCTQTIARTK